MKYNRKAPRKTITVFVIFWSILAIAIIASIISVFGKMINRLKKLISKIIMKLRWRNIDGKQDESKKKT